MPLDDEELDKLCHARIVIAKVYDSQENAVAKERPAIIISTNEQIQRTGRFRVVAISHNTGIDSKYILAVPAYSGFDGHIIGSFAPWIEEADVKAVCGKLFPPDMAKVLELVRQADEARKSTRK